jgi:aspartate aminotransferase-like enzyme
MDQLLFIPGPVTVSPAVLAASARPMIDHRGPEFAAMIGAMASGMQPIFGTAGDVVFLGSSGTGGLEAAVASLFAPGERVLACPVGVFGKRLIAIARMWGLEVEEIATPPGSALDPAALAARLYADPAHTFAGVLLTHNETSTGVQNDMAALARAIGGHPALAVVDSVSGLGASEFRMDDWHFDVVVSASQKALAAPPGIAMAAVSERAWKKMGQAGNRRFYFDLAKAREFAALGQTPWTPPVSVAFALDAAIAAYHAEGAPAVWRRHAGYASAIRAGVEALGLEVFSRPDAHSVTVVSMSVPDGVDAARVRAALDERFGIVMGGGQQELKGKILRMGTMGALAPADVIRGLDALERTLADAGFGRFAGRAESAARPVLDAQFTTASLTA